MVVPAMQVANRIPDVYLQLWASSLLKGEHLYFLNNVVRIVFPHPGVTKEII